jgi:hypothetical protein
MRFSFHLQLESWGGYSVKSDLTLVLRMCVCVCLLAIGWVNASWSAPLLVRPDALKRLYWLFNSSGTSVVLYIQYLQFTHDDDSLGDC